MRKNANQSSFVFVVVDEPLFFDSDLFGATRGGGSKYNSHMVVVGHVHGVIRLRKREIRK